MIKYKKLTAEEQHIIIDKGTEQPFSGEYNSHRLSGVYTCKQCSTPLYTADSKFDSGCGWPSFDAEIPGMVIREFDNASRQTEIICANCQGHLGHVFTGERLTAKNTRHCVNSLSLKFIKHEDVKGQYEIAVFASGCFWGTEYCLRRTAGVIATTVGYAGGTVENQSYQEVCRGATGHAESVRIIFDPNIVSYTDLVKLFFETHDPTQKDGQGPDIGSQYRSVIFYTSVPQQKIANELKNKLISMSYKVVTQIEALDKFYPEEDLKHQRY